MEGPSLMFESELIARKGWFQPAALDFTAKMSPNVSFDVPAGRVAHLNDNGEYEMGLTTTGMPIFLRNAVKDFDVNNPGTTPKGNFMHQAIAPTGKMTGLVATGAYELQTTEFDDEQSYKPGDLLTAAADNDDSTVGGVLTNDGAVQYDTPCCGVVSVGAFKADTGVRSLAFWPIYLPGAAT